MKKIAVSVTSYRGRDSISNKNMRQFGVARVLVTRICASLGLRVKCKTLAFHER